MWYIKKYNKSAISWPFIYLYIEMKLVWAGWSAQYNSHVISSRIVGTNHEKPKFRASKFKKHFRISSVHFSKRIAYNIYL